MMKVPAARPVIYWVVVAAVVWVAGPSYGEPVIQYVVPGERRAATDREPVSAAKLAAVAAGKNTPSPSEAAVIQAIHSPAQQANSGQRHGSKPLAHSPADQRSDADAARPAEDVAKIQSAPDAVQSHSAGAQLRVAAARSKTAFESVVKPAVTQPTHQRIATSNAQPARDVHKLPSPASSQAAKAQVQAAATLIDTRSKTESPSAIMPKSAPAHAANIARSAKGIPAVTVQATPAPVRPPSADIGIRAAAALIDTRSTTASEPSIKPTVTPPIQQRRALQVASPANTPPALAQVTPAPIHAPAAGVRTGAAAAIIDTRSKTASEPLIKAAVTPPMPQRRDPQIARPVNAPPAFVQVTPAPIRARVESPQRTAAARIQTTVKPEPASAIKLPDSADEQGQQVSSQAVGVQVEADRRPSAAKVVLVQKSMRTKSVPRVELPGKQPPKRESAARERTAKNPPRTDNSTELAIQAAPSNTRTQIRLTPVPVSPLRSIQPPAAAVEQMEQDIQVTASPAPPMETVAKKEKRIELALFSPSRSVISQAAVKPSLTPEAMNSELVEKIIGRPSLIAFVAQPPANVSSPGGVGSTHRDNATFAANRGESDEVGLRPIHRVTINVRPPEGELPPDHAGARFARDGQLVQHMGISRHWMMFEVNWESASLATRPVYFEDVNLERYGFSHGLLLEPIFSAAHFFVRIPFIPYMRGASPPRKPVYTLGYGRPGTYFPYYLHRPPISVRGGLQQAVTAVGLVYILP